MKTKFTMTIEEAQARLSNSMADDLPYSDNEVEVIILPPETDNLSLNKVSKIALIKFARAFADDLLNNRVKLATRGEFEFPPFSKYCSLGETKAYVEKYLTDNASKS